MSSTIINSLITPLLIVLVLSFIFRAMKKEAAKAEENMDGNHFLIRQSKFTIWIGIVCVLFFGGIMIAMTLFPNDTATWWVYFIFALFGMLGIGLALFGIFWKVEIIDDNISYHSPFKSPKHFSFEEITNVKIKRSTMIQVVLYSGKRKLFSLDSSCKGFGLFVERLKEKGFLNE